MGNSLRDLQLCELQILKDIKALCEKNGIRYYLSAGTLLGAVRHQGFIPWDDDIDVEMPYRDYLRFIELAPKELGDEYYLQNSDTDRYFCFAYSRIRKNHTTMMRSWEKKIPSHHGVWVDVWPLVYIGSKSEYRFKRFLLTVCTFLRMHKDVFAIDEEWIRSRTNPVLFFAVKAVRLLPERWRWNLRDRIVRCICTAKENSFVCYPWSNLSKMIDREAYIGSPAMLTFEDETFPAPPDYDRYLTQKYRNYMMPPPPERRKGHGNGEDLLIDLDRDWTEYTDIKTV